MTACLRIAVPSKGRIMEETYGFFEAIGTRIKKPKGGREYVGALSGVDGAEILFMSASEIAAALHAGAVHLGVTGEDLLREKAPRPDRLEDDVVLLKALDFGHADLVLAVPNAWIDVQTMADLEDVTHDFRRRHHRPLRVATKYLSLTRNFFAAHGIADYRIIESSGATEGAPAAGLAEVIADITSTGATLKANNLRILTDGVMLRSQVQLAAARKADWRDAPQDSPLDLLAHILDRLQARDRAADCVLLQFHHNGPGKKLATAVATLARGTGSDLVSLTETAGELRCPKAKLYVIVNALRTAGVSDINVVKADYIFTGDNPLFDRVRPLLTRS